MKTGTCPKCHSTQIYKKLASGYRGNIMIKLFSNVRYMDYICSDCGFIESYILDTQKLDTIKKNWEKVYPQNT